MPIQLAWIKQLNKPRLQAKRSKRLWLALPLVLWALPGASYADQVDVTLSWPPQPQALLAGEPAVTVTAATLSPGTNVRRRDPVSEQELIVIGRDAQGRERYRTVVADPSAVRAEVFDPISGEIQQRRDVTRPVEQLRLTLPQDDRVRQLSIYRPRFQSNGYALEPMAEIQLPQSISAAPRAQAAAAAATTPIINNGPSTNRVDLVFIGDGYTAAEQGKFAQDINNIVGSFFNIEPYISYAKFFNVHRVDVVSAQSGVDHPERGVTRNTALDGTYNCSGIQRLICANTTKVNNAVAAALPAAARDIVIVVVNDSEYGGSGGAIGVISTNAAAVNIALHEAGHSFGLLADEYNTDPQLCNLSEPREPNSTTILNRSTTKWSYWISASTPLPTSSSFGGTPGLYLGSRYCTSGMYRPTADSMMRSLGKPFYAINEEALVKRYYAFTRPIDAASPVNTNLSLASWRSQVFTITPPPTLNNTIAVSWFVDGVLKSNARSFTLAGSGLTLGTHVVRADVRDTTTKVRRDTSNVLRQSRSWNVNVIAGVL